MSRIGEEIRKARNAAGISQYELAKKVGNLNQSQIAKIERGARRITTDDLIRIARALQVDASELLMN